jgi:hypothetical protein
MGSISLSDAMNDFDHLLKLVQDGPVHVRDDRGDLAVMISPEEYLRLKIASAPPNVNPKVIELFTQSLIERAEVYKALAKWEAEHPEPNDDS